MEDNEVHLILSSCVPNCEYYLVNILTLKRIFLIEKPWDELNDLHSFIYYLFAYDDFFLKYGLMLKNPKAIMSMPIVGVSYVFSSLFDTFLLKLYGPQLVGAKLIIYS